ncbi:hypothetical protein [Raoultella terrigena]|uniref:hypothetical protein n=1 Tax=Raoultella terrigena TaxID=577 RepID=UPI000F4CC8DC|nr:hypothetical protein [Raoultella terrigena]
MKIYWTKKSIPELADLPQDLRRKNFKDAYSAISTHIEYWVGGGIALLYIVFFFRVYDYFLPGLNSFPRDIVRTVVVVYPAMLIWFQFTVYGMRKHYRHILEREKNKKEETDVEKLIREADAREYKQWMPCRRLALIIIIITGLLLFIELARTTY